MPESREEAEVPSKPKATVAYLRTATADRRVTRMSLERQYQACEERADALGLRVSTIYFDIGVSGLSERRPALDQLMRDLSDGRIGHVVMADPDRLARNWRLEEQLHKRIRSHGADASSPCDSQQPLTERRIGDTTSD
ncbi:MAG TPA: recombinase family protein [Solirubrobacteraceae bacterium]|nr:recombinase family protein [Solirubrobacteraceae bacterium]